MSLSTEPWFVELFEKCSGDYVGNSDPLREADLISASKKYNISIPRNFENRQVLEFLNWRILSLRASMVPTFRQNKKQPLRLRDYEIYLKSIWASSPSTLKKTLTAITRSYIPYLKNRFSTDASLGVRNISNPWSLRIQLFENPYFSDFQNFCDDPKHQTSWHLLSNLKKLLLHTKSSVRLTRRKKHDTGAPEIEALLNDYLKASTSYTSAKTAASDTRRIIQMANIKNLNELLSTEGQKRIVALEYEGQVGQYAMSRPRICLRWIFETCHASYIPYFSDMSEEKIFDLSSTPEVTLLIERGWSTLSEYKHTNINKLKTLFRLLLRATNIKTKKAFYALRPSDFIIAALQAEHHGNYLQSFRAIYMFRLAFLERLPRSDQWPEYNSQSYKKFCQEIQNTSYFQSTMLGKTFRFSDFEATFSSQGAHWNLFFKELQNFYYRIADLASENNDNTANFSIAPDDFQKAQNFVLNGAYGEKCSRRQSGAFRAPDNNWRSGGLLKKRTYTTDEKRNLEFLAAYAFQAAIACRFANEASQVVFAEDAPRFVTADGPHKLFWWKEKNCYAVLFSKTRKNKVSYLAPLNDSADAIIKRYLQVSPKKHGEYLFNYNIQRLVDEIKKRNVQVYKASCSLQEFIAGIRMRGITPHSMRHILRQYIESHYNGVDKELILTVALGHKIPKDTKNRSSASGYYGDDLNYSLVVFDQLRRIKNGVLMTPEQMELQKLRHEMMKSDRKTRKQLKDSVDQLKENADVNIAIAKANLLATLLASNEDFQSDVLLKMLQTNPQLLVNVFAKKSQQKK